MHNPAAEDEDTKLREGGVEGGLSGGRGATVRLRDDQELAVQVKGADEG